MSSGLTLYFLWVLVWPTRPILAVNCRPQSSHVKGLVSVDLAAGTDWLVKPFRRLHVIHPNHHHHHYQHCCCHRMSEIKVQRLLTRALVALDSDTQWLFLRLSAAARQLRCSTGGGETVLLSTISMNWPSQFLYRLGGKNYGQTMVMNSLPDYA